jgi:hypothetical protein
MSGPARKEPDVEPIFTVAPPPIDYQRPLPAPRPPTWSPLGASILLSLPGGVVSLALIVSYLTDQPGWFLPFLFLWFLVLPMMAITGLIALTVFVVSFWRHRASWAIAMALPVLLNLGWLVFVGINLLHQPHYPGGP